MGSCRFDNLSLAEILHPFAELARAAVVLHQQLFVELLAAPHVELLAAQFGRIIFLPDMSDYASI